MTMESIILGLALELTEIAMVTNIMLIVVLSFLFVFSENLTILKKIRGGSFVYIGLGAYTVILSLIFVATTLNQIVLFILSISS